MSTRESVHFERLHAATPAPFNKDYDPRAREVGNRVADEMQAEGFYDTHDRAECAYEYRRRTKAAMAYLRGCHDHR